MKNRESSGWSSITPQFEPRFQTQPRSGSSPSSAFLAPNFNGHVKPSPRLAANLKLHEEYDEEELAVAFDAEAVVGAVNNGAEVEYGEERECVDEEEGEDEEEEEDEDVAGEAEEQGRPKLADGFYAIESIRKKRIFKGQPQYLIKWLGWPDSSNTWEPLEHLQTCADVVEAFEERQSAEKKTYRKRKCQFTQPKKKMQYAYGLSKSKAAFIELPFSEKASNLKPPLPSTNGHAAGPTEYYDEEPSSATKDSEESPVNCQTIGSKEKNHDGDNNHEGVNANKFSVQFQPILSLDGEKSQICLSKVENKDPTPSQRDRCPGAKQRKSGFVRRFKQDTTSFGPTCAQNYGIIDLTSCDRMGRQMGNNNFDLNASAITTILNPIGYSPSVSNDVHDVSVTFMAMRADGEEVLVDNKFLKANNPLLLINFYEQHLRCPEMEESYEEMRSLALTPSWSVATVLTIFIVISLMVERSIHLLGQWLQRTNRRPLLQSVEKMKEELMLLGFISLLLTATSSSISNICIESKFFDGVFAPCTKAEIDEERESEGRNLLMGFVSQRRMLNVLIRDKCPEGYEPFVSYQGLEQLHRFIFIMAVTHVSYSCLTMLLAIVKIQSWRAWEEEACADQHDSLTEITRELVTRRHSTFVKFHVSNPLSKNRIMVWVTCFFRQFGRSVVRTDYLTLRKGFIMKHRLRYKYDFHGYLIRSMEEEFQRVVGVSGPLWGFVIAFMLFDIKGSNLYFWIAIIPISLVLLVGTKLQHVIATLTLEGAGISGFFSGTKIKPRDDLFWFKKPELLLKLIHFILFQNSFELASFFWFWWQFGYNSCFISSHLLVYSRLIIGFFGQFLCSYSTLPLYALVTQMGTHYKAALVPLRIRETLRVWKKSVGKKKRHGYYPDDSTTVRTETSTVESLEEDYENTLLDIPVTGTRTGTGTCMAPDIELQQPTSTMTSPSDSPFADVPFNSRADAPLLKRSASMSFSTSSRPEVLRAVSRCYSMPVRRG